MLGKTSESELSDHLYDLIYELNAIAPSVLLAVLPQLEFKLKVRYINYTTTSVTLLLVPYEEYILVAQLRCTEQKCVHVYYME